MRSLLDVNVLISLLDRDHVDHAHARQYLKAEVQDGWASRAITQNDVVRVMARPTYPSPAPPATVVGLLRDACATRHHEFWPCTPSLLDTSAVDASRLHGHRQVTDAYLLALAVRHGGRLVTFDVGAPS